jgi:hypothetical protein
MNLSSVMLFLALLDVFSHGTPLSAQRREIKLINGRNGHPVANACVNVWVGNERKDPFSIPTDSNGIARLRLTENDSEVNTDHRWAKYGDFGVISPVVKYKDFVKVNVGYVVCEPHGTDFSWLEVKRFPTKAEVRSDQLLPRELQHQTGSGTGQRGLGLAHGATVNASSEALKLMKRWGRHFAPLCDALHRCVLTHLFTHLLDTPAHPSAFTLT